VPGRRVPPAAKRRMLFKMSMMESPPMIPDQSERELLFRAFARAFLSADMAAMYQAVTPDFLWSYHDGLSVTK
jgi:hypothetical protein